MPESALNASGITSVRISQGCIRPDKNGGSGRLLELAQHCAPCVEESG